MISNKAKYAYRALLTLAAAPPGEALTSSEIAKRCRIPHKFLEQILLDLKKADMLTSRRGKNGGYALLRPAESIMMGEVLRLFEGPLAPLPCLSRYAYRKCDDCDDEISCGIRREFASAFEAQLAVLEIRSIADALKGDPLSLPAA